MQVNSLAMYDYHHFNITRNLDSVLCRLRLQTNAAGLAKQFIRSVILLGQVQYLCQVFADNLNYLRWKEKQTTLGH